MHRIQAVAHHLEACPASGTSYKPGTCPANPNATVDDLEKIPPKRVVITGAAGQIAYSLIFQIATGRMLGPHQRYFLPDGRVFLVLLDIPQAEEGLKGVVMEVEDCALPLVTGVLATSKVDEAFAGAEIVLMVGAFPRKDGMERKDLLEKNCAIFKEQGAAIDRLASREVRVCVVGNPANTNCFIAMSNAPSLPRTAWSALTRLDHNRATAAAAARLGVPPARVANVTIWGNHSATQVPDLSHATVRGVHVDSVPAALNDPAWIAQAFVPAVQQRGAAVIKARKLSSAASAANAIVEHVRDWVLGTPAGRWVSMAVPSDGSYNVPPGIVYSFPVTCANGRYTIVPGLAISAATQALMDKSLAELEQEAALAKEILAKK